LAFFILIITKTLPLTKFDWFVMGDVYEILKKYGGE